MGYGKIDFHGLQDRDDPVLYLVKSKVSKFQVPIPPYIVLSMTVMKGQNKQTK